MPEYNPNIKQWLAVYTRPRMELKVKDRLESKGITSYCPAQKVVKQWSDRKKKVLAPVLTGYVFVYLSESERISVLEDPSVVNFVFWQGKPAVIRDQEIEDIKKFLDDHDVVNQNSEFQVGDKVVINYGDFAGQKGELLSLDKKWAILRIRSLGFELRAKLSQTKIAIS